MRYGVVCRLLSSFTSLPSCGVRFHHPILWDSSFHVHVWFHSNNSCNSDSPFQTWYFPVFGFEGTLTGKEGIGSFSRCIVPAKLLGEVEAAVSDVRYGNFHPAGIVNLRFAKCGLIVVVLGNGPF